VKTKLPVAADYRKLSDEELIHRFTHRQDQMAINFLFERYGHLVLGVCFKHLKSGEAAKDATQQIFIKLLDDLHRFKIESFRPWLYQVTRNFCLMELRRELPVHNNEFVGVQDMETDEDWQHKIEQEHLYNKLEVAMTQLNKEQRVCIELFYLEKMTYSEIAANTGFSLLEVKSFLQNGKRNLKIKMEALTDVKL
jgi:RNA polymerase sigma factor (sigma-70 family)